MVSIRTQGKPRLRAGKQARGHANVRHVEPHHAPTPPYLHVHKPLLIVRSACHNRNTNT